MCGRSDKPCILIVEDHEDSRAVFAAMLEAFGGYCTRGAGTAGEVINFLDENCREGRRCPDLVLLDIDLPDVKGGTLGLWIRAVYPRLPIIFMTAYGRLPAFTEIAANIGSPLMAKPLDPYKLIEIIDEHLREYAEVSEIGRPLEIPQLMLDRIEEIRRSRAKEAGGR